MKILLVNKYLYPVGGAEEYVFSIGKELTKLGNEVQYFGIDSKVKQVANASGIYGKCYETNPFLKLFPSSMIYSRSAKAAMDKLLDSFHPDIIHLNNINFQLTPSIIYSAKERRIPVVWTLHDPQLVCPNHRLFNEGKKEVCTKCLGGDFTQCIKNRCFKGSLIKSIIGCRESQRYHKKDTIYNYVSAFISPSRFLQKLTSSFIPENKVHVLPNYSSFSYEEEIEKKDYFLYFGRLSQEKGIYTLLHAIPKKAKIVIAGNGPLENDVLAASKENPRIQFVGFKKGKEFQELISHALCSIYPSEWYENCPLSILESLSLRTPVIGSDIGGIPELIEDEKTGLLFKPGDSEDLRAKMERILTDHSLSTSLNSNLEKYNPQKASEYIKKLLNLYACSIKESKE